MGAKKFLDRVWRLFVENNLEFKENKNLDKIYNQTVKKVTEDYESLNINTAISQMMIFVNAVYKENVISREQAEGFIKLLNPLCPHITEEIWETVFDHHESLAYSSWPAYDEAKLKEETYEMVVQINGKIRGKITVSTETTEEEMLDIAKSITNVQTYLEGVTVVKVITVPKKLINIVVK